MYARAYITLAREFSENSQFLSKANELLAELLELAESNSWGSKMIEILVLHSLALDVEGKKDSALVTLERAIALAEPEGYIRTFVDEGPPMAHLLYKVLSQGTATDYVQRLLAAFTDVEAEQPKPTESQISEEEWIEPLSERELDVLHLISEGLTNQEIATKLYLSLNTVKAHTRNIYGKLGVNNRTQAGARARALGILESK